MRCPDCGLTNPPEAIRCDCGFDFKNSILRKKYIKHEKVIHRKSMMPGLLLIFGVIAFLVIAFIAVVNPFSGEKEFTKNQIIKEQYVILDGYDSSTGEIIQEINLWKDYKNRTAGIVTTANHGERVRFIEWSSSGDAVLVETKEGLKGWVTYYFIKQFKF